MWLEAALVDEVMVALPCHMASVVEHPMRKEVGDAKKSRVGRIGIDWQDADGEKD